MSSNEPPPYSMDELNPYAPPLSDVEAKPLASQMSPMPIRLGDILGRTWEIYRDRMAGCIGVVIGSVAIMLVPFLLMSGGLAATEKMEPRELSAVVAVLGGLTAAVMSVWIHVGLATVMLDIARGRPVAFGKVFSGGRFILRFLLAGFLFTIALYGAIVLGMIPGGLVAMVPGVNPGVAATAFLLGGMIGVIGSILLAVRMSQFVYLIVDRDAGYLESLRLSFRITRGNAGMIIGIALLMTLINFAGALACFVGQIFTVPFALLLLAVTYLALTGQEAADPYSRGAPKAPDFELG